MAPATMPAGRRGRDHRRRPADGDRLSARRRLDRSGARQAHEDRRSRRPDAEGFVRVTGRSKDLIIRGGVNIAPLEIDEILIKHPGVAEAAAVGVPDKIYGEEVVCYVVPKDRR